MIMFLILATTTKGPLKAIFDDLDMVKLAKKDSEKAFSINKGLAFELIMTHWFRESDNPQESRANVSLNEFNQPKGFASQGLTDAVIKYDKFKLSLEVSAKDNVNDFKWKLESALRHIQEDKSTKGKYNPDTDFCILIANKDLYSDGAFKTYMNVINNANKNSTKKYNVIPMSLDEIQKVGETIDRRSGHNRSGRPKAEDMQNVFKALNETLQEAVQKGSIEKGLLTKTWLKTLYPDYKPDNTPDNTPDNDQNKKKGIDLGRSP